MMSSVDCIRQFRRLRALVIGDAMLDTYYEGTAARLCSEGPVPVVRKLAEHQAPGGAANTAANLRAMGAEVRFLSIVGDDHAGKLVEQALNRMGIGSDWLVRDPTSRTPHKMRILADGHYVVRFDDEMGSFGEQAQAQLLELFGAALDDCDVVIISDYGYEVASDALIAEVARVVPPLGIPLLVDSKDLLRFRDVPASVITPNHKEAQVLAAYDATVNPRLNPDDSDLAAMEAIGRDILGHMATACVAITLASRGVLLIPRAGKAQHLPAHPVVQPNDVGAGDSFTAALALALATDAEMNEAAQIALDAASIAVSKQWTAVVPQRELLQRASLRDGAASHHGADEMNALIAQLAKKRQQGKRIVFTNGIFDVLHAGHMHLFRQAKALGDVLVVGVNSDRSIAAINAQRETPIRLHSSESDRVALVSALEPVDFTIRFHEPTPTEVIRRLRPHVHVKGGDYADEALPESAAVQEYGGKVVIVPLGITASVLPEPGQVYHVVDDLMDERFVPDISASLGEIGVAE